VGCVGATTGVRQGVGGTPTSFSISPVATARIYTKTGDDGTTGLLYGGRVRKDSAGIQINGTVDEAQAALGLARAETDPGSALDDLLTGLERELYVLMAEVATPAERRSKLKPGETLVTAGMIHALEERIDDFIAHIDMPTDFVVPGANRMSAALDLARTIVRRAERLVVSFPVEGSEVPRYLNRLSDLLWAMARAAEGENHPLARRSKRGAEKRGAERGGQP
jgi:cob(I)alamin adenosyltransferase